MSDSIEITFSSTLEDMGDTARELELFLEQRGLAADKAYAVSLAFEEFATNTIKYGYKGKSGKSIRVRAEAGADFATLIIEDNGLRFDPLLDAPEPDVELSAEERDIGGLGIHLIKKLSKALSYEYVDGKNVITVEF